MHQLMTPQWATTEASLSEIERLDQELYARFAPRITVEKMLTRQLVSFQANKTRPVYRWYKYKEAFSALLVDYLLTSSGVKSGVVLDPFAGSGTALFAASELGLDADGIELLPIGQEIIKTKRIVEAELNAGYLDRLQFWIAARPWQKGERRSSLHELRITKGAYPPETKGEIEQYLGAAYTEPAPVQAVLRFALLCVLEEVSYTRKDGQYLRWDHRSGRTLGKKRFDKGSNV